MNKIIIILILLIVTFSCKTPEARKPISAKSGSFINQSIERNKLLLKKENELIKAIITKDTILQFQASENGFWYAIETALENNTPKAEFGDIINYNYNISDLNGNIIYSTQALKTQNYAMDQQELFSGLREGLKLMQAGETFHFIFPSQKAFGYYGDEDKIGTNMPIRSKVTVNSITKK
ncbi:gliding motility-associated peptidyl-prolyl isomerase GldI [uncultured Lacinutrix sp.]|uniref:gliding motility-associated peptidyl-prolyl isomerase GldI n=1 Tax=uncultured Lacinutrix sp. TaxID=574032 RepID=UPI002634B890|nr:gliding motility-associated peptidyl-prolyl isomerase GldI [uncultured Lacinutrix sp.]